MHRRAPLLICLFCLPSTWAASLSVTGVVKDSAGKTPVSGAFVYLRNNYTAVDTTDESGAFTLSLASVGAGGRGPAGPLWHAPAVVPGKGIGVGLLVPGRVVITAYKADGRQTMRLERNLPEGRHVIGCGVDAPGVALYRIRAAGHEYVLRQVQRGDGALLRAAAGASTAVPCPLAKDAAFSDTLLASKLGYATKRVVLTSTTVSGLQIEVSSAMAYAVVNLTSGAVTYAASMPELETNAIYKTTHMVLRRIKAGMFKMGSETSTFEAYAGETPVHLVFITKDFYMNVFEVTRAQWDLVTTGTGSSDKIVKGGTSWLDITRQGSFMDKLNAISALKCRLPTEAEWEYGCKAGTSTNFSYGDSADIKWMWTAEAGGGLQEVGSTPKRPNPWGLYDLHGNAWELCSDWLDQKYYDYSPMYDPTGPKTNVMGKRVLRSGCGIYSAFYARSSRRGGVDDNYGSWPIGFRAAADAPPP